ncbi:MAG: DUF3343 domain-containing protein [Pedobacter sp.]
MIEEGHLLAVFNSAHRVMKAENILKAMNLPILIIPAPSKLQTDCGMAIRFSEDILDRIMEVLASEKLLPEFVTRYEGGQFVRVWTNSSHP